MFSKGEPLINKAADNEAVQNCHGAALGGRKHTKADTQNDANGEEEAPEGVKRLLKDDFEAGEFFPGLGIIAFVGNDGHGDHHGDGHEDARHIACRKRPSQGGLGDKAEHDQVDPGGDNGSGRRGGGSNGGGEGFGITAFLHFRHQHLGLHGAVGVGGAGAAAHEHTEHHIHLARPPFIWPVRHSAKSIILSLIPP